MDNVDNMDDPKLATDDDAMEPPSHAYLLEEIVRALVDDQSAVRITEKTEESENRLSLIIGCAKEEIGRIVGYQGETISAIRLILKKAGIVDDRLQIQVEIEDDRKRRHRPRRRRSNERATQSRE